MENINFETQVERIIKISKNKPLLPETFIPWQDEPTPDTHYLPERLISLEGHPLWNELSSHEKIELGKLEVTQVMYSYAWSETLANYFFNRHLLSLKPTSVEYRFLLREIIEECRHQEMFGMCIQKLGCIPEEPTRWHKLFANMMIRYFPDAFMFISVISVELMADLYAKHIRQDPKVYSVLRKSSELHHIEEGRHIYYTELWLERFTKNCGVIKSTLLSLIVMANIYFMKTLYVKESFFQKLRPDDSKRFYNAAKESYNLKFGKLCLDAVLEFVNSFNGFNQFTKFVWNRVLKTQLS